LTFERERETRVLRKRREIKYKKKKGFRIEFEIACTVARCAAFLCLFLFLTLRH
jgi:hypothetical protein